MYLTVVVMVTTVMVSVLKNYLENILYTTSSKTLK
jgi:hypothetical protein